MSVKKHLIVGSGAAGLSALKEIRKNNPDDEIKIVTMEDEFPYSPMALPYVVSGRRTEEDIIIANNDFLEKFNAGLLMGKKVVKIDTASNKVVYENNETEEYDTLLIATGSTPKLQPILADADVPVFHIKEDLKALKEIKEKTKVTILGAGFVGLELAASLAGKGCKVKVIAPRERILRQYFDSELDEVLVELLNSHGIEVLTKAGEVSKIDKSGDGYNITLSEAGEVATDVLLAATGVKPRLSFIEGSGIEATEGILVDEHMCTNIPNIYAAGDVAVTVNYFTEKPGLSLIWPSAIEQGKIAGRNMVGKSASYQGWLPMNAFNFFGHYAISVGHFMPADGDEVLSRLDKSENTYRKIVLRDEKLIGANFFNVPVDGGVLQYLIKNKTDIGPHKELLLENPKSTADWLMLEAEKRSRVA